MQYIFTSGSYYHKQPILNTIIPFTQPVMADFFNTMQLRTKKVIAREFIILLIAILLVAGAFGGTYIYNSMQNNQALQLDDTIVKKTAMADNLAKSYKLKRKNQQWFYDKNNEIVDLTHTELNSPYKLWQRLDYLAATDSIQIKLDSVWTPEIKELLVTIDFDNPKKLIAFIDKNRITETDSTDFATSTSVNTEIEKVKKVKAVYKAKMFSVDQQKNFTLTILGITLIVLFGLRYLIYSISWSVKILKQKG